MIDFPTNPPVDTEVTTPNGVTWKWTGTVWELVSSGTGSGATGVTKAYTDQQDNLRVLKAGDTMTGNLTVPNAFASAAQSGAINALTRKDYVDYQVNRANWNSAWGQIGVNYISGGNIGNAGSAGTFAMCVVTASPFTEGRRVRINMQFMFSTAGVSDPQWYLYRGNGTGGSLIALTASRSAGAIGQSAQITANDVMTSGTTQWTFAINSVINSPLTIYGTSSWTNQMTVDDIGPITKQ